jgi:hypothetical protein
MLRTASKKSETNRGGRGTVGNGLSGTTNTVRPQTSLQVVIVSADVNDDITLTSLSEYVTHTSTLRSTLQLIQLQAGHSNKVPLASGATSIRATCRMVRSSHGAPRLRQRVLI